MRESKFQYSLQPIANIRSIISDIFYLIREGLSPDRRSGLKPQTIQDLYYWIFQP